MLDASLNEVEALAAKAARGAGLPWGLAEDAAYAARWLAGFGLPWAPALVRLLSTTEQSPIAAEAGAGGTTIFDPAGNAMSPLLCGPALADRAADVLGGSVRLRRVAEPLWLLPFAAQASLGAQTPIRLRGDRIAATVSRHRCWLAGDAAGGTDDIVCTPAPAASDMPERPRSDRARVDPDLWAALDALAARTYVPASDVSRARGAGTGREVDD